MSPAAPCSSQPRPTSPAGDDPTVAPPGGVRRRGVSASTDLVGRLGLLQYRPLASPLHATRAGVAALWALSLTVATLLLYHPLGLAA